MVPVAMAVRSYAESLGYWQTSDLIAKLAEEGMALATTEAA